MEFKTAAVSDDDMYAFCSKAMNQRETWWHGKWSMPCVYRGVKMRSKLELRTALFIDLCGGADAWSYEKVCIVDAVTGSILYNPDFCLHDIEVGGVFHPLVLLECKGVMLEKDEWKIGLARRAGVPVLVIRDLPFKNLHWWVKQYSKAPLRENGFVRQHSLLHITGESAPAYLGKGKNGKIGIFTESNIKDLNISATEGAYANATAVGLVTRGRYAEVVAANQSEIEKHLKTSSVDQEVREQGMNTLCAFLNVSLYEPFRVVNANKRKELPNFRRITPNGVQILAFLPLEGTTEWQTDPNALEKLCKGEWFKSDMCPRALNKPEVGGSYYTWNGDVDNLQLEIREWSEDVESWVRLKTGNVFFDKERAEDHRHKFERDICEYSNSVKLYAMLSPAQVELYEGLLGKAIAAPPTHQNDEVKVYGVRVSPWEIQKYMG